MNNKTFQMTTLGSLHAIAELFRYLFEPRKKEGNNSQKNTVVNLKKKKHCQYKYSIILDMYPTPRLKI